MLTFKAIHKDKSENNPINRRSRSRSAVRALKGVLTKEQTEKMNTQNIELVAANQKISNLESIIEKMQQEMIILKQQIPQQQHQQQQIVQMLLQQKKDQSEIQRLQKQQKEPQPSTRGFNAIRSDGIPTSNGF